MDEILERLDGFIREQCEVEPDDPDYSVDANLFDLGYMDSMGAVRTVMFAEESFDVEISQRDITLYPMNTVREIAAVIAKKKGI